MDTDFPNYYTAAKLTLKREPLRRYYDWVWFQRQIDFAGFDRQLGGYIPHTPFTMLPLLPLTGFSPMRAKQIWILLQVVFLATTILLLARMGRLSVLEVLVLALLAHNALANNLRLGQYYLLLLLLLTLGCWSLLRGREWLGGALLGVVFALKLYTAPFVLYFAVRRQWKAFWGFLGTIAALALLAIAWFGWSDVWYFANTVMARAIDGSVNDPYNPGWASMTALFRKTFMAEAELNPHPLWHAPAVFFFIRSLYTIGIVTVALVALAKTPRHQDARALAWFVIVLFVLSPNAASYHFVLLLVPVALLLPEKTQRWSLGLIILYILVELPLVRWDAKFFPKAWVLLALFLYVGWTFLRSLRPSMIWATVAAVVAVSAAGAFQRMRVYLTETPQHYQHARVEPDAIFSASPAQVGAGWIYESIGEQRYLLKQWNPTGDRTFAFDGDAFHPTGSPQNTPFGFELVHGRSAKIAMFDPLTANLTTLVGNAPNPSEPALSPDGSKLAFVADGSLCVLENSTRSILVTGAVSTPTFFPDGQQIAFVKGSPGHRSIQSVAISGGEAQTLVTEDCFSPSVSPDRRLLAFTCSATSATHIWIQDLTSRTARRLTSGFCNDDTPAWDGSQSIVFASDCSRGLGLPALYRAPVEKH